MQIVKIPIPCHNCGEENAVEVNLFTGEHKQLKPPPVAGFRELIALVDHYKRLKGFDAFPTWDSQYKGRSMKAAKQILRFFRKLPEPVEVARECISEISARATKEGWSWTIETVVKMAPDWLAAKAKDPQR